MKTFLRKIFFWDEPAQGTFLCITLLMLYILMLTGCISEYERIDSAILKPTLAPNVYCDAGKHEMPQFTAEQVLLVRPLHIVKIAGTGENAIEYADTDLLFPDGKRKFMLTTIIFKLKQLWESGDFRIIVYDEGPEEKSNPFLCKSNAYYLRAYAMEHGIPFAILYGRDSEASILPGIPQNLRQFWQCPECAKRYSEQQKEASQIKWNTANVLLFPLNVVPDMLVGICYYTGAFVYSIFTSDEFGWYVLGLPFAPLWGAFDGITNALEGKPFWNMKLMDGDSRVHKD